MMIIMILVIMTIMNTMIVIMMIMITSNSIQIPSPFCIWNFVWVEQFKCICVVREAPLKLITQAFGHWALFFGADLSNFIISPF